MILIIINDETVVLFNYTFIIINYI